MSIFLEGFEVLMSLDENEWLFGQLFLIEVTSKAKTMRDRTIIVASENERTWVGTMALCGVVYGIRRIL